MRDWGIEATSYEKIGEQVKAALDDERVKAIQLDVDSPGGLVNGVAETADAILAARQLKPVRAVVDDLAASAAYWLCSQADTITAGKTDMVGGIGVFSVYVDYSEMAKGLGIKVHVIRSGPHKGIGVIGSPISEDQLSVIQELIDGTAKYFVEAISAGRRRRSLKEVTSWATGKLWLAEPARDMGLIDTVSSPAGISSSVMLACETPAEKPGSENLAEPGLLGPEGIEAVRRADLKRFGQFKEAVPDLEFAVDCFQQGLTIEQAKEQYAEHLTREQAARSPQLKADEGPAPIPSGNSDNAVMGTRDFLTEARQLAGQEGITVTAAMRRLARSDPELHTAFRWSAEQTAGRLG